MFNRPGGKLKTLAIIVFIIELIGCLVYGIVLANVSFWYLVLVWVVGGFTSYITALALYSIGESEENSRAAAENTVLIYRKLTDSETETGSESKNDFTPIVTKRDQSVADMIGNPE